MNRIVSRLLLVLGALLFLGGCAHSSPDATRLGVLADVRVENCSVDGEPGKRVITPHYMVYATVMNDDFLESIGHLMEGALAEYRRFAPDAVESDRPMECYLFANRPQWAKFTKARTGEDASVYLQINRGGYTVRDCYVAYFLGESTFCVAAHEGFHQFAARHFRERIPPFLEEGIACMFEDVTWDGRMPKWDLSVNYGRQAALRKAVEKNLLLPLDQLAVTHAGLIISKSTDQIGSFYAQCWAFARFLWQYNNGQYRPALQQMLTDAAEGNLYRGGIPRAAGNQWDTRSAKPMLEHYLQTDLATIDAEYQHYMLELGKSE